MKTNWELALVSRAAMRWVGLSAYLLLLHKLAMRFTHHTRPQGGSPGGAGAVPAQVRAALPRLDEGPLPARFVSV